VLLALVVVSGLLLLVDIGSWFVDRIRILKRMRIVARKLVSMAAS